MQVKIEQDGWKLNSFERIVEKAVNAKTKAAFRPCFYACNTNQQYFQGSWPSTAKTNTQDQLMKDLQVKEPKPRS